MTSLHGGTASVLADADRQTLREIAGERARFDEPLANYTSWRIGGPADAFVQVASSDELARILRLSLRRRLPWFVLGSGSNLLVGDGGIRGIVVRLGGEFAEIALGTEAERVVVRAGASASLPLLVAQAATHGAVGVSRSGPVWAHCWCSLTKSRYQDRC